VPFKKQANSAFSTIMPFFNHPDTKKKITGQPNKSIMQTVAESMALSTPEIWALNPEVGKEVIGGNSN
jgi:hypothetical protein